MSAKWRWLFIAFEACLIPIAWLVGRPFDCHPAASLVYDSRGVLWGTAATIPMIVGLFWALRTTQPTIVRLRRVVDEELVPIFRNWSVFELTVVSALAGIGEELLFRGVVQELAVRWFGTLVGLIAASVLFGAVHWVTRTYAVVAGVIGLYLGALWLATGNLLAPIVAHGLYDLVALLYMTRRRAGPAATTTPTDPAP